MVERRQDVLRLQPHMLPALRAALETALHQLNDALAGLGREGYLPEPWLGDEISDETAAYYTRRAMNEPDSSYQALITYRDELKHVHDTLRQMEDHYRRTEGENAAVWGHGRKA